MENSFYYISSIKRDKKTTSIQKQLVWLIKLSFLTSPAKYLLWRFLHGFFNEKKSSIKKNIVALNMITRYNRIVILWSLPHFLLSLPREYTENGFSLNSIVTASYFKGLFTFQLILFSRQMSRIYHLKILIPFFMLIVVQSEHPIVNADNKWVNTTTKTQLAAIDEFSFVGKNYEKKSITLVWWAFAHMR